MYWASNKSCLHMEIQDLTGWMIFQTYLFQYSAFVNNIKVL